MSKAASGVMDVSAPVLPESVEEASLLQWHVQQGGSVEQDQLLAELETDKVVLEVVAPATGTLKEVLVAQGESVLAGQLLARIDESEADVKPSPTDEAVTPQEETPKTPSAPLVRGLGPAARQHSRKEGAAKSDAAAQSQKAPAPEPSSPPAKTPDTVPVPQDRTERRPMSRLRATIARRMLHARQQTAMLTTFNEADMSQLIAIRNRHKDAFEQQHGIRLGFMSFFVRAAVQGIRQFPLINASIDGDDILMHKAAQIGIAMSTDRGLIVPVLRRAERLSLQQIEQEIRHYGEKAGSAKLLPEDLQGGTFTISNGGIFGSLQSTPILNPPQSAILGMHRIQKRPIAIDDEVVIRPMMNLALSYDHRLIDGKEAVGFLVAVKQAVEDPLRLLLEI